MTTCPWRSLTRVHLVVDLAQGIWVGSNGEIVDLVSSVRVARTTFFDFVESTKEVMGAE